MSMFYNSVTNQYALSYSALKSYLSFVTNWSATELPTQVNNYINSSDPNLNPWYAVHPEMIDWDYLDRDAAPTGVKLWQVAELDAPVYDSGTGRWSQSWTVRSADSTEMIGVNSNVSYYIDDLRDEKLVGQVTVGSCVADATPQTESDINNLISAIVNKGTNETVRWEGPRDVNNIPQWSDANVSDLQAISVALLDFKEKAYEAAYQTWLQQLDTPFDYYSDIDTFFSTTYDGL